MVDVTEAALVARPEMLLRALSRLRTPGWGIALDDIGADSRSLALMSLLYPDVIKLDLRLLRERSPRDVARIVAAVGAEAERRRAAVLAEGIDGEEQLATARAPARRSARAFSSARPARCRRAPATGPRPAADRRRRRPRGLDPFPRITNWRRPTPGTLELAACAAGLLLERAAGIGETALVLAALPDRRLDAARALRRARRLRRVRRRARRQRSARGHRGARGPLEPRRPARRLLDRVVLDPDYSALLRRPAEPNGAWAFATSFDRETVLECAVPLMARMQPL